MTRRISLAALLQRLLDHIDPRADRRGQAGDRLAARPGQALVMAALTATTVLLLVGLAVDLGLTFEQFRAVANRAERAARAAAMELDEAAYLDPANPGRAALDPARARAVAAAWLAPEVGAVEVTASVAGGPLDTVAVTAARVVPTAFMRLAGVESIRVSARAVAQLEVGP